MTVKVAVIGGGAAGFFAAISCKESHPSADVRVYEKTSKLLSKVKVSGGGRCNVTHDTTSIADLIRAYPRGGKFLKKPFHEFMTTDTVKWFEDKGIELKTEEDNRMFPVTDDSLTIVDCLLNTSRSMGVRILKKHGVDSIVPKENGFELEINGSREHFDKVIVSAGGFAKKEGYQFLDELGHKIIDPIPSLFTFNMPKENISELQGISVPDASVTLLGSKLSFNGPALITHWGMSGPAILKLSAFGAEVLNACDYEFQVRLNWVNRSEEEIRTELEEIYENRAKMENRAPFKLPSRLWSYLLEKSNVDVSRTWVELSKKDQNRLIERIMNDVYQVNGKTTFKEEFVTCGGIDLNEVSNKTMGSKLHPGLYFCGEILNIDGMTGGFNFQSAWTTAYIAGQLRE